MKPLTSIMLIDDNEADNDYHELVIQRADITTKLLTLSSSIKAVEYFKNCLSRENDPDYPLPDLVFIDLNMPALNGFEVLDRIRQMPDVYNKRKQLKIYMLTGSLNPDDFLRASTSYADIITGFRIKPLSETIFQEIASKHIDPR